MSATHAVLHSLLQASTLSSPSLSRTNYGVGLSENLTPKDPRRFALRFRAAKEKEIEGLARRGTWRVVCAEDLPEKANVMGGRFVLTIKNKDTQEKVLKARFVVQGH